MSNKKSANYYINKIDMMIYRLENYMDETDVDVRPYTREMRILQREFYEQLSKKESA
tara:strand:- start:298 stop:468 length:171 start_codon:yes stop_codon:yes gene_type:complete